MKDVKLTVDVMCKWGPYSPSYRLYIDGELLTERTYVWNNPSNYVKEHLVVSLTPGTHSIEIEKCGEKWVYADFSLENFTVNGKPVSLVDNQFTI